MSRQTRRKRFACDRPTRRRTLRRPANAAISNFGLSLEIGRMRLRIVGTRDLNRLGVRLVRGVQRFRTGNALGPIRCTWSL
jgi:hypothetical protein